MSTPSPWQRFVQCLRRPRSRFGDLDPAFTDGDGRPIRPPKLRRGGVRFSWLSSHVRRWIGIGFTEHQPTRKPT